MAGSLAVLALIGYPVAYEYGWLVAVGLSLPVIIYVVVRFIAGLRYARKD